ncbi:MAG: protein-disulfide reductase DsbD N-terminal domain-containing protein [Phycisphaerae bacterium]|nr:protein-disulfide reductase DsbD N-terminal domain-containing protein [Phycisphaerae bacterium]
MNATRHGRGNERSAILGWLAAGGVLLGCGSASTPPRGSEAMREGGVQPDESHARVEVLVPKAVSPGTTIDVGVRFTIEKDWHLYWNGQNDSGTPIVLELRMPAGFKAKEALWPAPERLVEPGGILNHIYEREVILIVPVEVGADAKMGPAEIRVDARWLACKEACVPESGGASASISIEAGHAGTRSIVSHESVAKARAALPIELAKDDPRVRVRVKGTSVELEAPGAVEIAFMPGPGCASVKDLSAAGLAKGARMAFEVEDDPNPVRISGIVRVANSEGVRAYYHIDTHAGARPADGQERPGLSR